MAEQHKVVVRFNFHYHPAMAERLAREPDIELRTCDLAGPEERARADLAEAHAYQISSAKDELPRQWFASRRAARTLPPAALRVGDRRRLRHRRRRRLHPGRRARREPVRRQRPGGRRAHARADARPRQAHHRERPPAAAGPRLQPRGPDGPRDRRQDPRPGRHRPHRRPRRQARGGLRNDGARLRSLPDRGGDRPARRHLRDDGRTARAVRLRLAALPTRRQTLFA